MSDDDLDLDLELDDEPAKPQKAPAAKPEPEPAADKPAASAAKPTAGPAVTGERKGLFRGLSNSAAAVKGFSWNARTFAVGLAVLLVIVIFAENWAPVRFYCFGFALEVPKAVCFLLDVALGAVLMWLWQRRAGRAGEADQ